MKLIEDNGEPSLFSEFEAIIFIAIYAVMILLILLPLVFCCKAVKLKLIKVRDNFFWNGVVKCIQLNFMKVLFTSLSRQDTFASISSVAAFSLFALGAQILLYKNLNRLPDISKRWGMLFRDLKVGRDQQYWDKKHWSWMYIPVFI